VERESRLSLAMEGRLGRATVVEVIYPKARGAIGLRGSHAPLSWTETTRPTASLGERHVFELAIPDGEIVELKLVRGNDEWSNGRNYTLHAGDHVHIEPAFERTTVHLQDPAVMEVDGTILAYRVLLPPSYDEQETKRYPVLYAQDGQALWSTSTDPFGIWRLDTTLDQLLELGVIEELIVVAIDTSESRIERLTPVPDPEYGGGHAAKHLAAMTDALKPRIDADLRTRKGPTDTGLMGSSLGGLFSFYAAWTRPDVFGKAICLSSSFWWASRHMIRAITAAPSPRPIIYLDSGAPLRADEPNAGTHDGFHDTRSMHRTLGRVGYTHGHDVHRLTFPGHAHDAAAWAARVAIPLQLLFGPPPLQQVPAAAVSRRQGAGAGR
jgi:predicted alpha/beta superfamily hydrolase